MTPAPLSVDDGVLRDLERAGWSVVHSRGPAAAFHARDIGQPTGPALWIHETDRVAAVLGSSQSLDVLDLGFATANNIEVSGRRSGGGLVVVDPATSLWLDIVLPPSHPRWIDDVTTSFDFVGQAWADALSSVGAVDVDVHHGPLVNREHGRVVCFAGLGPGEVLVEGRKVVGLSQRRGRFGARFQCLVLGDWPADVTSRLLRPAAVPVDLDVAAVPAGLRGGLNQQALLTAFLRVLLDLEVS